MYVFKNTAIVKVREGNVKLNVKLKVTKKCVFKNNVNVKVREGNVKVYVKGFNEISMLLDFSCPSLTVPT